MSFDWFFAIIIQNQWPLDYGYQAEPDYVVCIYQHNSVSNFINWRYNLIWPPKDAIIMEELF